ncbi:MAG: DUF4399 domain-containing protein [Gemmatimonadota bacterium]|nr:MAG: DUF4399 domain-containing protein [Gemmatimonadota bacterium]
MRWSTPSTSSLISLSAALLAAWSAGCQQAEPQREAVEARDRPAATIVAPADGDTLSRPEVRIEFAVEHIALRPAGTDEPDSGHLHLFVNRELTPAGEVIPAEQGIVHLGQAQTEHLLEDLEPGDYTVIAVLGDYLHVRIPGAKTDTVRFTVRG